MGESINDDSNKAWACPPDLRYRLDARLQFTFGTLNINGDWSFKLPVLMQAVPCSIQLILLFIFCPESPRFLVSKGKYEDAIKVLAKFHANGKEDDELVQ